MLRSTMSLKRRPNLSVLCVGLVLRVSGILLLLGEDILSPLLLLNKIIPGMDALKLSKHLQRHL